MTVRLSHKKRPPFLFSHRARVNQLVCDPRGYIRAWGDDGRPLYAAELAWTPGPTELGVTGDGSFTTLYGSAWLTQICSDGSWVLYKRIDNETLEVVPWDVTPPIVAPSVRHHTSAFDQSARPMVAYEDVDGITLRQFDEFAGEYRFTGPYSGVDPVLWTDAAVNFRVGGSDVILSYLSTDRLSLKYRMQSENFETEHHHYTFSSAAVLDRHDLLMLRYQLKYGLENGSRDTEGDPHALRSLLYPYYASDHQGASIGNFAAADYQLVVIVETANPEALSAVVGNFAGADYHTVIIVRTPDAEALTAVVGNFAGAESVQVVTVEEADVEALTAVVGNFAAAVNALVVILREPPAEALTATVGNFAAAEYVSI